MESPLQKKLKDGDKILMAEGCTHHRQCDDIGTVKMPGWVTNFTGKKLQFSWTSGGEFPADLSRYQLIIHCGGCMINRRQMLYRIEQARAKGVPIVNYGVFLAYVHGILARALEPFPLARLAFRGEEE